MRMHTIAAWGCLAWTAGPGCDASGGTGAPLSDTTVDDSALGDGVIATDAATGDTGLDSADGAGPDADTGDVVDLTDLMGADTDPPAAPEIALTVNRIPVTMNGSAPFYDARADVLRDYTLRVNRENFTLDALGQSGGGPIDWTSLVVVCDDGAGGRLTLPEAVVDEVASRVLFRFDPRHPAPDGATIACEATVSGPGGSAASGVAFEAATLPSALDPFATEDVWLVVLSRDLFEIAVTERGDGTFDVASTYVAGGNGVPDFDEAWDHLGLRTPEAPLAWERVRAHLLRRLRARIHGVFGLDELGRPTPEGVRIRLWFEGDEGAPTPADFASGGLSMIALGGDGDAADQRDGTFGRALIDWNNQGSEDDTVFGLGVFPTALVRAVLGQEIGLYLLEDLLPVLGGEPLGARESDLLFLGTEPAERGMLPDQDTRRRAQLYDLAIDIASLTLSSILAHEMGHSLGLVPLGPPPVGLFAGVEGPALHQSSLAGAHIDTDGLNIMQTGGSVNWLSAFSSTPRFNPLNAAYLRRQLVVGPQPRP